MPGVSAIKLAATKRGPSSDLMLDNVQATFHVLCALLFESSVIKLCYRHKERCSRRPRLFLGRQPARNIASSSCKSINKSCSSCPETARDSKCCSETRETIHTGPRGDLELQSFLLKKNYEMSRASWDVTHHSDFVSEQATPV